MTQIAILLMLILGEGLAQKTIPTTPQKSSELAAAQTEAEVFRDATLGDRVAIEKLKRMAQAGDAEAQWGLGVMYAEGLGIPKDAAQGVRWYRKAAEQGIAKAQDTLGWMYSMGVGVQKDEAQASRWYRRAAEQGDANAQWNLGLNYEAGGGVIKDAVQAVVWYRKSAERGFANGQFRLGLAYARGKGVAADLVAAYTWLNLAAAQTQSGVSKPAEDARDIVEGEMSEAQIAEAQNRSREREAAGGGHTPSRTSTEAMDGRRFIPMLQEGGIYKVPVMINEKIVLNFIVDSGAADVTIPSDVATTLMRTGTITKSDFKGVTTYTLADGSTTSQRTFRIKSLKLGELVLEDVTGSVSNANGDLLFGQRFLRRFRSWSIDSTTHTLVLE